MRRLTRVAAIAGVAALALTLLGVAAALALRGGGSHRSAEASAAKARSTKVLLPAPKAGDVSFAVARVRITRSARGAARRGTIFSTRLGGLALTARSSAWRALRKTTRVYVVVMRVSGKSASLRDVVLLVVRKRGRLGNRRGRIELTIPNARPEVGSYWVRGIDRHGVAKVYDVHNALSQALDNWSRYLGVLKAASAVKAALAPILGPGSKAAARSARRETAGLWSGGQKMDSLTHKMGLAVFSAIPRPTVYGDLKYSPLVPKFIGKELNDPAMAARWKRLVARLPATVPDKYAAAAAEEAKFERVGSPKITPRRVVIADNCNADCQMATDEALFGPNPGGESMDVSLSGAGLLYSTPPGIYCLNTRNTEIFCHHRFTNGERVTLTEIPAQGWAFVFWTGDCTTIPDTIGANGAVISGNHCGPLPFISGRSYTVGVSFLQSSQRVPPTQPTPPPPAPTEVDSSFGHSGTALFGTNPPATTNVNDVRLQPDGKPVVLGQFNCPTGCSTSPTPFHFLERLNTDGSLDNTFNNANDSPDTGGDFYNPQKLLIVPGGGILAAGVNSSGNKVLFSHFDQNGNPPASPTSSVTIPGVAGTQIYSVVRQPNSGKMDLVGTTFTGGSSFSGLIVQLTPTFDLDTGFGGGNGYITFQASATNTRFFSAATQSTDQIVVGGAAGNDGLVAGFDPTTGSLATGFGPHSGYDLQVPGGSVGAVAVSGVATDSADRVLTGGIADGGVGTADVLFERLTPGGMPDSGFNGNSSTTFNGDSSFVALPVPSGYNILPGGGRLAFDLAGNLVLGGDAQQNSSGGNDFTYFARLTPFKAPDTSFAPHGVFIGNTPGSVNAFTVQGDGKYLVGGQTEQSVPRLGYLTRYFGAFGQAIVNVGQKLSWHNDIKPSAAPSNSNPPGPEGVSILGSGNVLVTNTPNNTLESFTPLGAATPPFSTPFGSNIFNLPRQAAQVTSNEVDVSDSFNARVERIRMSDHADLGQLGSSWSIPRGIAVSDDQSLVAVADVGNGTAGNGSVSIFGSSPSWPTFKRQITGLHQDEGVAFDHSGNLWVANSADKNIVEYNPTTGAQITTWDGSAALTAAGQSALQKPTGIAVDPNGNIWVADFQSGRVIGFRPNGASVLQVITTANGDLDSLSAPVTLGFDNDGALYVADTAGDRVARYVPASP